MKAGARGRPAGRVAAGILVTRILGLVRERVFAHYFGSGHEADAFRAALRIPNIIRNLLGEGTLSASFIPVYASMLERDEEDAARRLSSVVASLLVIVAVVGATLGAVLAPIITDLVALGFDDATAKLRDMGGEDFPVGGERGDCRFLVLSHEVRVANDIRHQDG